MFQTVYQKTPNRSGPDLFDQSMQYWQVGNQKTFNKMQAVMWANGDLNKIHYHFMDDVWDQISWPSVPTQSLKDLMIQRCHQIRNQYKEVFVSYSGGYDSQGIIDSFIAAGVSVDGIIVRIKDYKPTEENRLAIQQANALKNTVWPSLKIDVRYYHAADYKNFYKTHKNDWITAHDGVEPWFPQVNIRFLENYNKSYQSSPENFLSNSRCEVYGIEKPRLWIEDGNWYATMIDKSLCWSAGANIEKFYISRQLPELHWARTWSMLNWLESHPFTDTQEVHKFLHAVQSYKLGWDVNQQWNAAVGCGTVLNQESYRCGGTKSYTKGSPKQVELGQQLINNISKSDKDIVKIWEGQLDDFLIQYSSILDDQKEIGGLWSKKYYIKPVEPGINFKESI